MSYVWTPTNRRIDIFNFRPSDADYRDIALGLSNRCRWGALVRYYSISQHSVIMAATDVYPREMLMHDATETYLGDWTTPMKVHPVLGPIYREIEAKIDAAIAERFDLTYPWPAEVKYADEAIRRVEYEALVLPHKKHEPTHLGDHTKWTGPPFKTEDVMEYWNPVRARINWLSRYAQLFDQEGDG